MTNLINKTDFNVSSGLLSASNSGPRAAVEDNLNRDNPRATREHHDEELQQAGAKSPLSCSTPSRTYSPARQTNSCKFPLARHTSHRHFHSYIILQRSTNKLAEFQSLVKCVLDSSTSVLTYVAIVQQTSFDYLKCQSADASIPLLYIYLKSFMHIK